MPQRNWESFLEYLYTLSSKLPEGRQQIAASRINLESLVEKKILPHLDENDRTRLFPMGFSPAESDLKIASGVGLERGYVDFAEYESALRTDKALSPFSFLQSRSGKTFGESIAPDMARFWIQTEGDTWIKISNRLLYDIGWSPAELNSEVRIELKSSTETDPRFQQIRHPRMSGTHPGLDYDILLCMGLNNSGIEWWVVPATDVERLIESGIISPQHGGRKIAATTSTPYWLTRAKSRRDELQRYSCKSEDLRTRLLSIVS